MDDIRKYHRIWRQNNKDKVVQYYKSDYKKAYNKKWRIKNKDKIREYLKIWRQKNKEKVAEYQKQDYKKNWYKMKLKRCGILS